MRTGATAIALLVMLTTTATAQRSRERVPGTRLSLVPPADFVLAEGFAGFEHPDEWVTLNVWDVTEPWDLDAIAHGLKTEQEEYGGAIFACDEVTVGDLPARLIELTTLSSELAPRHCWVLFAGDADNPHGLATTWMALDDPRSDALRRAMLSAEVSMFSELPASTLRRERADRDLAEYAFRLTPGAALSQMWFEANFVYLLEPGPDSETPADGTWLRVHGDYGLPCLTGPDTQRALLAHELSYGRDREVTDTHVGELDLSVPGVEAFEVHLQARAHNSGTPIRRFHAIVCHADAHVFIDARTTVDRWEALLPEFRAVVQSVVVVEREGATSSSN